MLSQMPGFTKGANDIGLRKTAERAIDHHKTKEQRIDLHNIYDFSLDFKTMLTLGDPSFKP